MTNNNEVPKPEAVKREAREFLMMNSTAVVATSHGNIPHASTVYYIIDEDFNFYFATEVNTRKYLDISNNSKVAIVVGTGPLHITVTAQGTGEFVFQEEQTAAFERLIELMLREHVKKWPIADMEKFKNSRMVVFKMTPEKLLFMNMDDENYSASISNRYMTIIPGL